MLATNCESPVVVVLSGSMEPGMYRGDILLLAKRETYDVGDIVVYKIPERDIPIVHRVLAIHERRDEPNDPYILTKGDNNYVDDRGLYNPGTKWLRKSDVMGTAFGFLPTLGVVTIYLNDYPLYVLHTLSGLHAHTHTHTPIIDTPIDTFIAYRYLIVSSLPCSFKWALLSALFLLLASGKDV